MKNSGRILSGCLLFALPYDECTWESLDETVLQNSSHLITRFKMFEAFTLQRVCEVLLDANKNKKNIYPNLSKLALEKPSEKQ